MFWRMSTRAKTKKKREKVDCPTLKSQNLRRFFKRLKTTSNLVRNEKENKNLTLWMIVKMNTPLYSTVRQNVFVKTSSNVYLIDVWKRSVKRFPKRSVERFPNCILFFVYNPLYISFPYSSVYYFLSFSLISIMV